MNTATVAETLAGSSTGQSATHGGPDQPRPYSTRELQAAAAALAAGRFSLGTPVTVGVASGGAAAADLSPLAKTISIDAPAPDSPRDGAGLTSAKVFADMGQLVRARAANAGAGASTMALAVADAADLAGIRTRVLGVLIDRVGQEVRVPESVPAPRDAPGIDLTVIDAGWTTRELGGTRHRDASSTCWLASVPAHVELVITRANTLALGQAEAVLAGLEMANVVVAVVGASRASGSEFAAAGPRLRRLNEDRGVVFVPLLPSKALPGLTVSELTPEVVAQLLDVVASHSVDHALSDMERMVARLRADAAEAAQARAVLRNTPAAVLREAMRLRAARTEAAR